MAEALVPLPPLEALALWSDVRRWPSFVEGLARVAEVPRDWPEPGSRVVWESGPGGRGRVTEKVLVRDADQFTTQVFEERLVATQSARFAPAGEGHAQVAVELRYELQREGPFGALADAIFVRRALRDALVRTLRRFAVEAEDEAGLR